jgi:hypothetical protein
MIIDCPHCQAFVEAEEAGQFSYPYSKESPPGRYVLLKCRRCESPILILQDNEGNLAEGDIWGVPTRIYPQPELRVNPKAPVSIRSALEEAFACYRARAFTAAAIMCRKTLEGVCEAHGINERGLMQSLRKMHDGHLIDNRLLQWSDMLRIAGNEAAHGVNALFSAEDARDIIDFTIGIIDYLFSYRDQFEKFKTRVGQRGALADH